jgi:hypothetical protein
MMGAVAGPLFGYHSGYGALVFPGPKGPLAIQVPDLRAMGWSVDDQTFRTLPRADVPLIDLESKAKDIDALAAQERAKRTIDGRIRGR